MLMLLHVSLSFPLLLLSSRCSHHHVSTPTKRLWHNPVHSYDIILSHISSLRTFDIDRKHAFSGGSLLHINACIARILSVFLHYQSIIIFTTHVMFAIVYSQFPIVSSHFHSSPLHLRPLAQAAPRSQRPQSFSEEGNIVRRFLNGMASIESLQNAQFRLLLVRDITAHFVVVKNSQHSLLRYITAYYRVLCH